jgi:uncharacterized protein (DUF1499 family)
MVAAVGLVLVAIAGPAYRFGMLALPNAFVLLQWAEYVGLAAVGVSVVAAALAYRRRARVRMLVAAVGLILGLAAFGIPFDWRQRAQAAAPIYDITTDLENPPDFDAVVPLRGDAPNRLERTINVDRQQRQSYPDLGPVVLPIPIEQAFNRALTAARDAGWEIVTAEPASGRIEATDTATWFGFEDDIVVRLTPWGAGTRIDVRSVSRFAEGDARRNPERIREYLARLQQ